MILGKLACRNNLNQASSMIIETRIEKMGLVLPWPMKLSTSVLIPFFWIKIFDNRAYVSGHGPQNPDGSPAGIGSVKQQCIAG